MSIYQQDWVAKWAVYSPDKIALKEYESGRTLTYHQWNALANRLANHLHSHYALRKGDRLAVLADNCLEYLLLFAVAQKTGIILCPLNYRLTSSEIAYLIGHAQPKMTVSTAAYRPLLREAEEVEDAPVYWALEDLATHCDPTQYTPDDTTSPLVTIGEDDPIFILYTSGTTGFPKGAIYSHKMLFWNSINTAMSLIVNSESRTINCMPPFHTGGWNVLTTPFIHHGGYTCLMKKFDATAVLQLLEDERISLFMGVPTMLKMIAAEAAFTQADLSALHYLIVGGESMPIPLINRWAEKGVPVRQGYGMTEVGPNLTSLHQDDALRKKGSIGRPNFYVDIKIVDAQDQEVAAGEAGELCLRGPMVTPGYWRNKAATAEAIQDGWFHSGDRVIQDAEGYLFVVDRIKNMFISGGENVYPAEVERVLLEYEAVQEAAVIGVPDERWGEVGKAFIVAAPHTELSIEKLQAFCQQRLARFKVPKHWQCLDALPKNDTGKIDRKSLPAVAS